MGLKLRENSSPYMHSVPAGLYRGWSWTPCAVTDHWALASPATGCGAPMPKKAAYLDGWIHYHLLITGGFSGGFITWAERVCGLRLHGWNGRGSAAVCRGVHRFLFQLGSRLLTIFISCVGISVLRCQDGSASLITSFLHHPHRTDKLIHKANSDGDPKGSCSGSSHWWTLLVYSRGHQRWAHTGASDDPILYRGTIGHQAWVVIINANTQAHIL